MCGNNFVDIHKRYIGIPHPFWVNNQARAKITTPEAPRLTDSKFPRAMQTKLYQLCFQIVKKRQATRISTTLLAWRFLIGADKKVFCIVIQRLFISSFYFCFQFKTGFKCHHPPCLHGNFFTCFGIPTRALRLVS